MIFTDRTVIVQKGTSSINDTIVLYRGDKDIEIRFTLNEGSPFKFGSGASPNIIEKTEAAYGQLVIKTPNDLPSIFSEIVPTNGGKIVFTITAEMIDEITEVGNYTFQIRLLDESRNSRATLPEVVNGIEIREPIATEDVSTSNEVGVATVGYALTTAGTTEDAFDNQGNYNKTTWGTGDRITAAKLNKIEVAIDGVNKKVASGGTSGGVDLSGYVTKETGNANQITFTDGQTFQAKLDAGTLKGEKGEQGEQGIQGEKGDKGADGLTTSISLNGVTYTQENGVITLPNITSGGNIPSVTQVEPEALDMPKVFFYGDISNMSKTTSVDLDFEYKSRTANYKGVANTKWQGSSSLSYSKKNYTIKLFTDNTKSNKLKLNLKGWGSQNKFCLKANYVDSLHVRNLAGARIAYDMIKSRSDFDSLPTELQEAPRCGVIDGFPIKVYMNGELMGLYTWNIPKDKWCSNMDEKNPNHAFLMAEKNNNGSATDNLTLACEFRANATIFADTSTAQYPAYDWVVEGPGDDVSVEIRTSFNNLINCVKDTDDDTFKTTIGNYLDLTSAFDYYCFAYLMCHYDGLGKNLGMATYDGVKWFCTLYDMDSIFGAKIDGSGFLETNRQCPEQYQETNSLLWQRIEKCFGEELYSRYLELRQGALSLGNIFTHVEEIYDVISDRVYKEDKSKWTSLPSASTNTIERIRTYMISRASYVDAEMLEIGTPVVEIPCTSISLDRNTLTFDLSSPGGTSEVITPTSEPGFLVRNDYGYNYGDGNPLGAVIVSNTDNTVDFIDVTGVESITVTRTNTTRGIGVIAYDSNKTGVYALNNNNGVLTWKTKEASSNDATTFNFQTTVITDFPEDVKYIRFCVYGPLDGVTITKTTAGVSNTQTLVATVEPSDCTEAIVWLSNATKVATVNNGLVTAKANGSAVITATCGTQSATCAVTVSGMSESGGDTPSGGGTLTTM